MFDEKKKLYYHGYDASKKIFWADPKTGLSKNFWLRAIGWFTVALADCAEIINQQMYDEYRTITTLLKEIIDSLLTYQDPKTKMFYQVVDKLFVVFVREQLRLRLAELHGVDRRAKRPLPVFVASLQHVIGVARRIRLRKVVIERILLVYGYRSDDPRALGDLAVSAVVANDQLHRVEFGAEVEVA